MTWVRQQPARVAHRCEQPMREFTLRYPLQIIGAENLVQEVGRCPDGRVGDLWRCTCGVLWRIGDACDPCDRRGGGVPHAGGHTLGIMWRPATLWQRLRYRKRPSELAV